MGADYNKYLNFNNKNQYAAINKVRTVDNVDYTVNFGCGKPSNGASGAIELQDENGIVNRLDVCKDGNIYNQNSKYMVYDEHNWGAAHYGHGGVDENTTSNTAKQGYYKIATLKMNNKDWLRTTALFYLCGEDVQYVPAFLYVSLRFNQITTSTGITQLTTYWNCFGTSTTTEMMNYLYFCTNKPTSNSDSNRFLDIYWNQTGGYNCLRYYLLCATTRTYYPMRFDFVDLYSPTSPTLTDLSTQYSIVKKAADVKNSVVTLATP